MEEMEVRIFSCNLANSSGDITVKDGEVGSVFVGNRKRLQI
jgi:hypothetical protein